MWYRVYVLYVPNQRCSAVLETAHLEISGTHLFFFIAHATVFFYCCISILLFFPQPPHSVTWPHMGSQPHSLRCCTLNDRCVFPWFWTLGMPRSKGFLVSSPCLKIDGCLQAASSQLGQWRPGISHSPYKNPTPPPTIGSSLLLIPSKLSYPSIAEGPAPSQQVSELQTWALESTGIHCMAGPASGTLLLQLKCVWESLH